MNRSLLPITIRSALRSAAYARIVCATGPAATCNVTSVAALDGNSDQMLQRGLPDNRVRLRVGLECGKRLSGLVDAPGGMVAFGKAQPRVVDQFAHDGGRAFDDLAGGDLGNQFIGEFADRAARAGDGVALIGRGVRHRGEGVIHGARL